MQGGGACRGAGSLHGGGKGQGAVVERGGVGDGGRGRWARGGRRPLESASPHALPSLSHAQHTPPPLRRGTCLLKQTTINHQPPATMRTATKTIVAALLLSASASGALAARLDEALQSSYQVAQTCTPGECWGVEIGHRETKTEVCHVRRARASGRSLGRTGHQQGGFSPLQRPPPPPLLQSTRARAH